MSKTMYKLAPLCLLFFFFNSAVVAQPLNDDCLNATPIAIPVSGSTCVNGNNIGATSTTWGSALCGQTTWTNDVWYTFVSNGTLNTITVKPSGSPAAARLGITVYTGSCGSLSGLGTYCAIAPNNPDSAVVIQASAIGTQYFIEVSSFNGDGNFQLCVNSVTPQPSPGSSCATASRVCALNPFTLGSGPSGTGGYTPDCFLFGANSSVWYRFTVGVSGTLAWSATPNLAGTELDWALYDITSACPGLFTSSVACNYNYSNEASNPVGMSTTSGTLCPTDGLGGAAGEFCPSITVTAGRTYAIVIDNFSNNGSGWDFNWTGSTFGLAPTSQFTASPSSICGSGGTVNITNTTIGGTTQVWNFGDGSASFTGAAPPAHNYTAPGTYVISNQVTNNGCTDVSTQSVQIIANPTVTVNSDTVCAGTSAVLTATPSNTGGTYSWSPGGATTQTITVSPGTNTTYTVTYTLLSCSGTGTGTVTVNSKPDAGIDQTVVCLTTDSATMAGIGVGTWSALSSNPGTATITTPSSPTTTITSFSVVGTYRFVWTSASGCTDTASVVVGNACGCVNPPTITISPKTSAICAGQTQVVSGIFGGSATQVSYSSSGTGTFSSPLASASPFNVTYTPSTADITVGTVTLYATTNNPLGSPCSVRIDSFTLNINPVPIATASNTGPYCEGATISLTGGVSGLTSYAWSGPNAYSNGTQSPSISSSTPAMSGVYTITVTDASSCTATATTTVEVNPLPQISAVATNTICTANNGMVVVTVNSGGTPGFNYTWSPANIDNDTINGLGVNTYNVTVTDSKNCSAAATANVGLTTNPVPITLDRIVNVKCNGLSTGEIDVTVGTGTLAYTYLWTPIAQSTEDATGLSAGAYTLIATDQFGCIDSAHYTVTEPTALNFSVASHTDASCYGGSNGTATLTVFGGSGTYHFLWNDPSAQTSATATGLAAGTYTATVTDDSACVATTSVTIAEPTAVTFATPTIVSPLCFRSADGSITSSASGGTGAINYSWSHNIGLNNTLASPLDTGVYFQIATDGNGCSDTAYFHIQDPMPIQFNAATVVDVNCNGAKDGSISSTAQGGTGTLTYGWNFDPTLNLTNLVGLDTGTYIHYATDINGCKDSAIYTIHEPTAVIFQAATIVNVSCNGGNDGSITSVALGGTGVITYSWSQDATLNSSTATNLSAGTYTQTASDANGCSITNTFTITEPTVITFGIPQLVMVTCNGGSDATITSAASGGTGVISYTWSHDGTLNNSIATGLIAGIYGQTVTDANGCSATTSFTVTEPTPIVFINPSVQDVKCHGENTGSIHSEATGGTGNIQYGWSHNLGLNSPDALNLIQGTYYQIATDANGCKDTSNLFVVNEPTQLTLLANATPELCIGAANGTITSIAGGGTPGYSFDLTLGGAIIQTNASGSFSSLSPATYIVDVTDANGCVEMQTATVYSQEHDMFTVDVDSTSCYGAQYKDGVIRVESQTLLNGPYQYSIDNGKTYSYVSDFYNLSAGVYTVFAKNNNGCDTSFIVEVPEPLPATLAIIPNDTSIHIGEQIGLAIQLYPYPTSSITSYHWTPAAGLSCDDCPNPTMTSYQKNNTYLLEVTYSNECKASAIATINIKSDTSLYIPNAFSPNGDGNNDLFEVYGRELKTVHMEVFNRWGEKVYDSMGNPYASWDGKYKGELQPPSVYVFSVEVEYLNTKKDRRSGSVTLIR
jgi:gliding motility-associated-like protein